MEKASKCASSVPPHFTVMFLSFLVNLLCSAYATDSLTPVQPLRVTETLLSKNGVFELGFRCLADCSFGIWFANSSTCGNFLIWSPGVDISVFDSLSLTFSLSEDGSLNLTENGFSLWSSSSVKNTSISAIAVLLDNGNLVVRDQANISIVFWQSFDYPSDKLLPGGSLGFNKITGKYNTLFSWAYYPNHAFYFSLEMDASRSRGFIIRQSPGGSTYAGTFPSWMDIRQNGDYSLTLNNASIYAQLEMSGRITVAKLGECSPNLWYAPESLCDFDSYCGPYGPDGLCDGSYSCTCPVGFHPPLTKNWTSAGCSRNVTLHCKSSNSTDQNVSFYFYPIDNIYKFPDRPRSLGVGSSNQCEASCRSSSSCTAYAYNMTCLLWYGELLNTVMLDYDSNGGRLYIRITKQQKSCSKTEFIVLIVGGVFCLIIVVLSFLWRFRRKLVLARPVNVNNGLVVFSYAQMRNATKSFSEKLGEGSFGCVFKGTLPSSSMVAVKKLKSLGQEEKQFRTEVQTIGMIQHINLVRLFGFCAEPRRWLVVYEYMVNGSLNSHLFSKTPTILSWELRYRIALGTSRGLAYLHEECKDCIVHCDVKPDNVLLDADFCPKIADFGMAKLLGRDFSRALTTMRGTIGYLAPEWISGHPITHKADVYSYGMMLFEIVSGRRNAEKIKEGRYTYFPLFAAVKVNEGDAMCLLDSRLEGIADVEQLNRACKVACWCIQDDEDHRPLMGQVVHMLEGVMNIGIPPVPGSLQKFVDMEDY